MKIQTISVMVAISVLIFINVQYAQAEVVSISGYNSEMVVFVYLDGESNAIKIITENNEHTFFDSYLKLYSSGSFSLKNPQEGIGLWAHLLEDGKYRITILTSDGVQRITANEFEDTPKPVRIEPKSSVGADITKHDIPVPSRDDGKTDFLMVIKSDMLTDVYLDKDFEFNVSVSNGRNGKPLVNTDVTIEIVRDDFTLKKSSTTTKKGGRALFDLGYLTYPLFYPNFCYDIVVTAKNGNHTQIWTDDFKIVYLNSYWHPDTSWIGQSAYSHYPEEYKTEPRSEIRSDSKCNE